MPSLTDRLCGTVIIGKSFILNVTLMKVAKHESDVGMIELTTFGIDYSGQLVMVDASASDLHSNAPVSNKQHLVENWSLVQTCSTRGSVSLVYKHVFLL